MLVTLNPGKWKKAHALCSVTRGQLATVEVEGRGRSLSLSLSLQCATRAGQAVTLSTFHEPETLAGCFSTTSYQPTAYRSFRKSNSAYYVLIPSASQLSTNFWFYPFELISHYQHEGDPKEYKLRDLLQCPEENDHNEMYIQTHKRVANRQTD